MTTTMKTSLRMIKFYTKQFVKELLSLPARNFRANKQISAIDPVLRKQRIELAEKEKEYQEQLELTLLGGGENA